MNELTKREIFALHILGGLVSKYTLTKPEDQQTISFIARELADTFIKELNKNENKTD